MSTVRLRRLQSDYEAMRWLVRRNPKVQVDAVSGNPPERYKIKLKVRSLHEHGDTLEFVDEHKIEIRLPLGYPRDAPVCRMLTPVFHPNIAPHAICIGDHWAAGESLDTLVMRICEMLAFQSYNIKSPLNGEAAKWVEENPGLLPLDADIFFVETEPVAGNKPVKQLTACSNCGETVGHEAEKCNAGHLLCANCVVHCDNCNRLLCMVCDTLQCPSCIPEAAS